MATIEAKLRIDAWKVKFWNNMLRMANDGKVDYAKHGLSGFSAPFKEKVVFENGNYAMLMVCTASPSQGVLSARCYLFDKSGLEIDRTDDYCNLTGSYVMYQGNQRYALEVESKDIDEPGNRGGYFGNQPWMYTNLGCCRDDFVRFVSKMLRFCLAPDYAEQIADKMADDVAKDVCDTADVDKWNDCDLRLAIGRVILKAVQLYDKE